MLTKDLIFSTQKLLILKVNRNSKARYISKLREGDVITLNTEFSETYYKKLITIKREDEVIDSFSEGVLSNFLFNVKVEFLID